MMGYNVFCNQTGMRLCWEKRGKEGVCVYVHVWVYVYVGERAKVKAEDIENFRRIQHVCWIYDAEEFRQLGDGAWEIADAMGVDELIQGKCME